MREERGVNELDFKDLIKEFGIFLDTYNQYVDENENHPNLHEELESILGKLQKMLEKIWEVWFYG